MRKILHFRGAGPFAHKQPQPLVIPEPALSARNLLLPAAIQYSSRENAALRNDNPLGILKLHH